MKRLVVAALLALSCVTTARAQEPTVVIVVRHAERDGNTGDMGLTEAGQARAQALARALADAKVSAVITTQWRRTQLTAAPLMGPLNLTPTVVPTTGGIPAHVAAVADAVRRLPGRTILVVGHSNTVPRIITALGAPAMADFCDNEYDGLYTIVIRASGDVSLLRSRFGAENGPDPADCVRPAR